MSLSAALLLMVPMAVSSGAGVGANTASGADNKASSASAKAPSSRADPIAIATARVKIVRPVSVRIRREDGEVIVEAPDRQKPQAEKDQSGTYWVEFS